MKIIHFSDPHACLAPQHLSALFDKRILGFFNHTFRRSFNHDPAMLDKAVEFILREKPDVAVCTGDITSTGQPAEFEKAMEQLAPLISSSIEFLYVPGNHDAYVKDKACEKALKDAFYTINGMRWDLEELPIRLELGGCEFIVLNECHPTNIFLSSGSLKEHDAKIISKWCAEKKTKPRILAGHFPVRLKQGNLGARRSLKNRQTLSSLLLSGTIDLSLCGHVHKHFKNTDAAGRGEVCAGSTTLDGNVAVIEYLANDDRFSISFVSAGSSTQKKKSGDENV
ncbi:MAG: metallophosphoesterase [Victivallales bacterium]|nr:metallophosphoesterase [Victivallales bacterium]